MNFEYDLFAIMQAQLFQPSAQAVYHRRKDFAQVDDTDALRLRRLGRDRHATGCQNHNNYKESDNVFHTPTYFRFSSSGPLVEIELPGPLAVVS